MTILDGDTIAALATPPGRGGVGIIRVSGPLAGQLAEAICQRELQTRHAHYCSFHDKNGEAIDTGIALLFKSPDSFTGEDVLELQGHGGPIVMDMLLQRCVGLGARHARAGEFSERAYLNDKLDLTQAEAIADLINSTTEASARSANRSLQGEFARTVNQLVEQVIALRIYVEAAIDFPEEEVDFLQEGGVLSRLQVIIDQLEQVLASARQGQLLAEGIHLVIAGKPNAGKSSLLNALSGEERAIVTDIAGTTRDVLRQEIQVDGIPIHVTDTAGLRDNAGEVEQEGIRRAWLEIEAADHVLLVNDVSAEAVASQEALLLIQPRLPEGVAVTVIDNKCDIAGLEPGFTQSDNLPHLTLSAKTGAGMDLLREHLKNSAGVASAEAGQFSARARHLDALNRANESLQQGMAQLRGHGAGELLAEDLRACQDQLGEITGTVTSDELLGHIFSSFCIGK